MNLLPLRTIARFVLTGALAASVIGCTGNAPLASGGFQEAGATKATTDDLTKLSDEFDDPKTLSLWQHLYQTEGWGANQLEKMDVGQTQSGHLTLMPYTSTWYKDYRGVLVFKPIKGDFVVTSRLKVSNRGGSGAPRSQWSLAGIMIRTPRDITPRTWRPGTENYVFLSMGSGDSAGRFQLEVKTTVNSDSQLRLVSINSGEATIRVARIGPHLIMMHNASGQWVVHQRYYRPDFPETLQAGLTCYSDYYSANQVSAMQHNSNVIRGGNADLVARADYVRFRRPKVPTNLVGKPLADPRVVSDQELLAFLGE